MQAVTKKRILRILLPVLCAAALLTLTLAALFYSGVLWFNMPSAEEYPVRGVDVSHYQGEIDWTVLSQENITFAFIKATEGSSTLDAYFAQNWEQARQTDLYVGAYHFFSFDSAGQTQAENFIAAVPVCENTLPPVIDLEYYGDKVDNPPSYESVHAQLRVLIDRLTEHYGAVPIIYTTEACMERYLSEETYGCPIWLRDVLSKPQRTDWTFWQYSNFGRLDGYSGEEERIDLNVYCGTEEAFRTQFSLQEFK